MIKAQPNPSNEILGVCYIKPPRISGIQVAACTYFSVQSAKYQAAIVLTKEGSGKVLCVVRVPLSGLV